jgi:hypothetical protein
MIELFALTFLVIFASMLVRTVTGFGSALIIWIVKPEAQKR